MVPLLKLQRSRQTREFQSRTQLGKPSKARMNGREDVLEVDREPDPQVEGHGRDDLREREHDLELRRAVGAEKKRT